MTCFGFRGRGPSRFQADAIGIVEARARSSASTIETAFTRAGGWRESEPIRRLEIHVGRGASGAVSRAISCLDHSLPHCASENQPAGTLGRLPDRWRLQFTAAGFPV